jgi:hypothetical protein
LFGSFEITSIRLNTPLFKENHLMTRERDALSTTSIFRFHILENNLNFFKPIKTRVKWHVTLKLPQSGWTHPCVTRYEDTKGLIRIHKSMNVRQHNGQKKKRQATIYKTFFESFAVATMTWLTVMEYLCYKWPRICSTCHKHFPILSSLMTCTGFVTRLTRRVSLVGKELLTIPEHLSSPKRRVWRYQRGNQNP